MRKALVAVILLAMAYPLCAAITLRQGNPVRSSAFSSTTTPALAYSSAVASGNTLVAFYSGESTQSITSVSDSVNGAWTLSVSQATNLRTALYYRLNTGAGTPTVTFTVNQCNNGCQITLFEVQGASTPQNDVTNNGNGTTGVSNPGNLNTTLANSILIMGTENLNGESTVGSASGGCTKTFLQSQNGFAFAGSQYCIVSATANYTTSFGTDTGGNWGAVTANFGESGGGAATTCSRRSLLLMHAGC